MRKYAPDYVSSEEYLSRLNENQARRALHDAAKLPPCRALSPPRLEFRKENEAAMARTLATAQQASAEVETDLRKLFAALDGGRADRSRLTGPRWQAGYDLAWGRTLAARVRCEGYNTMLASLKNGKKFEKADSTVWVLEPTDGMPSDSALDKMSKTARETLERVISEHPGTPWALLARRELETPIGWKWTER